MASPVKSTHDFVSELCELLGIEHDKAYKLQITIEAQRIVSVDVSFFPDQKQVDALPSLMKRFHLVAMDDGDH